MRIEGFYPTGYTSVPHSFIDQYMAAANGEFVKTYLLLLRLSESGDLAVSELADKLQQTEGDVRRALRYWTGQGLLDLKEKEGEIESIAVLFPRDVPAAGSRTPAAPGAEKTAPSPELPALKEAPAGAHPYSAEQLKALKDHADFDQLLFATEHYLGRTLTDRDTDILAYLYEGLGFPGEVLEYLVEYCVERWEREGKEKDKGYHLMRYMEVVALNWHSQGATTLEKAKQQTQLFARDSASFAAVAKALGLKNRQLTEGECRRVSQWMGELKMPLELILEACERTIQSKNTPDFRYTEAILSRWNKEGIRTLAALKEADEAGRGKGSRPEPGKKKSEEPSGYAKLLKDVDYTKLLYKKE